MLLVSRGLKPTGAWVLISWNRCKISRSQREKPSCFVPSQPWGPVRFRSSFPVPSPSRPGRVLVRHGSSCLLPPTRRQHGVRGRRGCLPAFPASRPRCVVLEFYRELGPDGHQLPVDIDVLYHPSVAVAGKPSFRGPLGPVILDSFLLLAQDAVAHLRVGLATLSMPS